MGAIRRAPRSRLRPSTGVTKRYTSIHPSLPRRRLITCRAIYNSRALEFVTGSGSSIGLPDLRAGRVIELQGLGLRFSGLYYITQATTASVAVDTSPLSRSGGRPSDEPELARSASRAD